MPPKSYPAKRDPNRPPMHPGTMLAEIVENVGRPITEIARLLGVSRTHLHAVLRCAKPVSPEMALRLGKLFGGGAHMWLELQGRHDLWEAEKAIGAEVARIPTLPADKPAGKRAAR